MTELRYIGRRKPKYKGGINKKLPPKQENSNENGFRKGMKNKLIKKLKEKKEK